MTGPAVAIVAPVDDLHAQALTAVLRDRHGIEAATLDIRRFPHVPGVFRLGDEGTRTFGDTVLDDLTAVWWRRPHPSTVSPTTFQDYIEPRADLRIVWIAGRALAVHIDSPAGVGRVDSRLDNSVAFTPFTLPAPIEAALATLMSRLGLLVGVIDMRLDHHGDYWFLEVNPQGQFAYLEIKTGIPMFAALADLFAGSHHAQPVRDRPPDATRRGP